MSPTSGTSCRDTSKTRSRSSAINKIQVGDINDMKYGNVPGTHTPAGAIKRDTHKTKRKRCISINVVVVVAMVAVVVIPEWR